MKSLLKLSVGMIIFATCTVHAKSEARPSVKDVREVLSSLQEAIVRGAAADLGCLPVSFEDAVDQFLNSELGKSETIAILSSQLSSAQSTQCDDFKNEPLLVMGKILTQALSEPILDFRDAGSERSDIYPSKPMVRLVEQAELHTLRVNNNKQVVCLAYPAPAGMQAGAFFGPQGSITATTYASSHTQPSRTIGECPHLAEKR